jgi:hypothetical protein
MRCVNREVRTDLSTSFERSHKHTNVKCLIRVTEGNRDVTVRNFNSKLNNVEEVCVYRADAVECSDEEVAVGDVT